MVGSNRVRLDAWIMRVEEPLRSQYRLIHLKPAVWQRCAGGDAGGGVGLGGGVSGEGEGAVCTRGVAVHQGGKAQGLPA